MSLDTSHVRDYLVGLQRQITQALTDMDGTPFRVVARAGDYPDS